MRLLMLVVIASATLHSQNFTISSTYHMWLSPTLNLKGTYLGIGASAQVIAWENNRHGLRFTGAYFTGSGTPGTNALDRYEVSIESKNLILERWSLFSVVQVGRENSRIGSTHLISSYDWFGSIGLTRPIAGQLSGTLRYSYGRSYEGLRIGLEHDL